MEKSPDRKSFKQLDEEKATCLEYALNGYIRIYEKGEKRCECSSCQNLNKVNSGR